MNEQKPLYIRNMFDMCVLQQNVMAKIIIKQASKSNRAHLNIYIYILLCSVHFTLYTQPIQTDPRSVATIEFQHSTFQRSHKVTKNKYSTN